MEGMESCEDRFQLTHANVTHSALQAIASERDRYPNGREATNTAGLKTKATRSNATVVVYAVPVDLWLGSNISPSSVVLFAKRGWRTSRLSSDDPQSRQEHRSLTIIGEVPLLVKRKMGQCRKGLKRTR
jgi:hypothetical protein